jgi:DNA-binding transcriptional regulator YhcF (GntR family)
LYFKNNNYFSIPEQNSTVVMSEKNFKLIINHDSDIPKYQQIVNSINDAVAENILDRGDLLPSVNSICKINQLSRDTVFKAYSILKDQRVIESVPNKGYYVAGETRKVLLVLDTFKAYKEVLYHSFVNNLPDNIITDVQFHHYNIENFKTIINNSVGKYYKYVVMNFDHKEVASVLTTIANEKLLLIDWNIHSKPKNNYVFQDFGKAFFESLKGAVDLFRKYDGIDFVYPTFTNHPIETVTFFKKFCKEFNFKYKIITNPNDFIIEKNKAYISVSDRILGIFLEQCREKDFEPGKDVGFLSYNETPMKKFIYKGVSVISTDFKELGTKGAEFITKDEPMQYYVSTNLIIRESL